MELEDHISNWMKKYCLDAGARGFVVGVSGGVDSALTSTLAARTGLKTVTVIMPIHQDPIQTDRGFNHVEWLQDRFKNVRCIHLPLATVFDEMSWMLPLDVSSHPLASANTKSRLRMVALYAIAGAHGLLVAGTGNRVEDWGTGFCTKGGDGMVDISPIGMLTKTDVWALAKKLGINQEIIDAKPTDGLWGDNRSDEDQIGATYPELEQAMGLCDAYDDNSEIITAIIENRHPAATDLTPRQLEVLKIYWGFHTKNMHKNLLPPVCPVSITHIA